MLLFSFLLLLLSHSLVSHIPPLFVVFILIPSLCSHTLRTGSAWHSYNSIKNVFLDYVLRMFQGIEGKTGDRSVKKTEGNMKHDVISLINVTIFTCEKFSSVFSNIVEVKHNYYLYLTNFFYLFFKPILVIMDQ